MVSSSFRFTTLALAASIVAVGSIGPALAREPVVVTGRHIDPDFRTTTVDFADLNLASNRGQRSLTYRVRYAIETVCGADSNRDLGVVIEAARCTDAAWTSARPKMHAAIDKAVSLAASGRSTDAAAATLVIALPLR